MTGTKENALTTMDGLVPTNMQQAMDLAQVLATSTIIPKEYQNKPGDVMAAMVMGADVGLKPMQALKSIAVINGKPSLYGDALLAVIKTKPDYEYVSEEFDDEKMVATCRAKRRGEPEVVRTFSKDDATKAALWGKTGPWTSYPKRMLQMRARGFAMRDTFAHHLSGISLAEEVQDIPEKDITPTPEALPAPESRTDAVKAAMKAANPLPVADAEIVTDGTPKMIENLKAKLAECKTLEDLQKWVDASADLPDEVKNAVRPDFNKRQKELKK